MQIHLRFYKALAHILIFAIESILKLFKSFNISYRYSFLEPDAYGHQLSDGLDLIRRHQILSALYGKTKGKPFLLIFPAKIANVYFIGVLSRHFKVIQLSQWPLPNKLKLCIKDILFRRQPIDFDYLWPKNSKKDAPVFVPAGRMQSSRDQLGLWEKYPIDITYLLSQDEINECAAFMEAQEVNSAKFLLIHVSTPNFYNVYNKDIPGIQEQEKDSVRNSLDLFCFENACKYILEKGYSVVQMGATHPRLPIDHPNFFFVGDCQCPPSLDLYLLSTTLGMIGTGCGPDSIPPHFGKPICIINQYPIIYAQTFLSCLIHPPILRRKTSGEILPLGKYLSNHSTSISQLASNDVCIESPSKEQILSTVAFFIDYYIESKMIQPSAFCNSWKIFNADFIKSLMILSAHYFDNSDYYDSIYSPFNNSPLAPPSAKYKWHYYINDRFLISPEFFKMVGGEWLDIRL